MSDIRGYFVLCSVFLSLMFQGHLIPTETSTPACFGISGPVSMNLTCYAGHTISIVTIFVGAKPTSSGCPSFYDPSLNNDTSCCVPSPTTDCIFAFDHTNYDLYHRICNGEQTCVPRAFNYHTVGQCNTTYTATTTFAYLEYICIPDGKINPICTPVSINSPDSYTYISTNSFPAGMPTSATPCDCYVQASSSSVSLEVAVLQRNLTGITSTSCEQSLTLLDSNEAVLSSTSCSENTFVTQVTTVNDNVIVRLSNNQTSAMGSFLMEIRDPSQMSNLTIKCSAVTITTTTVTAAATNLPNTAQSKAGQNNALVIIVVAVLVGLLFILVVILCSCWYRSRHRREPVEEDPLTKKEQTVTQPSNSNLQTDAKGASTTMPEYTAETVVQTKPIRVKQKSVGIIATDDETITTKPDGEIDELDKAEDKVVDRQPTVAEHDNVQNTTREVEENDNVSLRNNDSESFRELSLGNVVLVNTPSMETAIKSDKDVNDHSKTDKDKLNKDMTSISPEQIAKTGVRQICVRSYWTTNDTASTVVLHENGAKGNPESDDKNREEEQTEKAKSVGSNG